jgi:hypothetical protein
LPMIQTRIPLKAFRRGRMNRIAAGASIAVWGIRETSIREEGCLSERPKMTA